MQLPILTTIYIVNSSSFHKDLGVTLDDELRGLYQVYINQSKENNWSCTHMSHVDFNHNLKHSASNWGKGIYIEIQLTISW